MSPMKQEPPGGASAMSAAYLGGNPNGGITAANMAALGMSPGGGMTAASMSALMNLQQAAQGMAHQSGFNPAVHMPPQRYPSMPYISSLPRHIYWPPRSAGPDTAPRLRSPPPLRPIHPSQEQPQQKQPPAAPPASSEVDKDAVDSASARGAFGWTSVDGVSLPYLLRDEKRYVAVRMVELKLLSRYPSVYPDELRQRPPLISHYVTPKEAVLLNEINTEHCALEYGSQPFKVDDLIVRLEDFEEFYKVVRKHFPGSQKNPAPVAKPAAPSPPQRSPAMPAKPAPSAPSPIAAPIRTSPAPPPPARPPAHQQPVPQKDVPKTQPVGGWVLINTTASPYLVKDQRSYVPLSVIRYAAGLLNDVIVEKVLPTEEECLFLNASCQKAGVNFTFAKTSRLVTISDVQRKSDTPVTIQELPGTDPFGNAERLISSMGAGLPASLSEVHGIGPGSGLGASIPPGLSEVPGMGHVGGMGLPPLGLPDIQLGQRPPGIPPHLSGFPPQMARPGAPVWMNPHLGIYPGVGGSLPPGMSLPPAVTQLPAHQMNEPPQKSPTYGKSSPVTLPKPTPLPASEVNNNLPPPTGLPSARRPSAPSTPVTTGVPPSLTRASPSTMVGHSRTASSSPGVRDQSPNNSVAALLPNLAQIVRNSSPFSTSVEPPAVNVSPASQQVGVSSHSPHTINALVNSPGVIKPTPDVSRTPPWTVESKKSPMPQVSAKQSQVVEISPMEGIQTETAEGQGSSSYSQRNMRDINQITAVSTVPSPLISQASPATSPSLTSVPPSFVPVVIDNKVLSCIERGPKKDQFALVEALSRLYFPSCSVDMFRKVWESILQLPVSILTPEEEQAFIRFYDLPTKTLICNKVISIVDFRKAFDQMSELFGLKALHGKRSASVALGQEPSEHPNKRASLEMPGTVASPQAAATVANTEEADMDTNGNDRGVDNGVCSRNGNGRQQHNDGAMDGDIMIIDVTTNEKVLSLSSDAMGYRAVSCKSEPVDINSSTGTESQSVSDRISPVSQPLPVSIAPVSESQPLPVSIAPESQPLPVSIAPVSEPQPLPASIAPTPVNIVPVSEPQTIPEQRALVSEPESVSQNIAPVSEPQSVAVNNVPVSEPQSSPVNIAPVSEPQSVAVNNVPVSEPQSSPANIAPLSEPQSTPVNIAPVSEPQSTPVNIAPLSEPQSSPVHITSVLEPQSTPVNIAPVSVPQSTPVNIAPVSEPQSAPVNIAPASEPQSTPVNIAPVSELQSDPVNIAPVSEPLSVPVNIVPVSEPQSVLVNIAPVSEPLSVPVNIVPVSEPQSVPVNIAPVSEPLSVPVNIVPVSEQRLISDSVDLTSEGMPLNIEPKSVSDPQSNPVTIATVSEQQAPDSLALVSELQPTPGSRAEAVESPITMIQDSVASPSEPQTAPSEASPSEPQPAPSVASPLETQPATSSVASPSEMQLAPSNVASPSEMEHAPCIIALSEPQPALLTKPQQTKISLEPKQISFNLAMVTATETPVISILSEPEGQPRPVAKVTDSILKPPQVVLEPAIMPMKAMPTVCNALREKAITFTASALPVDAPARTSTPVSSPKVPSPDQPRRRLSSVSSEAEPLRRPSSDVEESGEGSVSNVSNTVPKCPPVTIDIHALKDRARQLFKNLVLPKRITDTAPNKSPESKCASSSSQNNSKLNVPDISSNNTCAPSNSSKNSNAPDCFTCSQGAPTVALMSVATTFTPPPLCTSSSPVRKDSPISSSTAAVSNGSNSPLRVGEMPIRRTDSPTTSKDRASPLWNNQSNTHLSLNQKDCSISNLQADEGADSIREVLGNMVDITCNNVDVTDTTVTSDTHLTQHLNATNSGGNASPQHTLVAVGGSSLSDTHDRDSRVSSESITLTSPRENQEDAVDAETTSVICID